jgi:predicted CopG family antitoxin
MTGRTTITTSEAAHDRLADHKREGESWTELFNRAAEALESTEGDVNTTAVANVDEIARATAEEVENRMTRR